MFPISATGPRRLRAAAGLAAALVAVLAGCGGGGDSGSDGGDQDALKAKLVAAADKSAEAPSLEASISIEVTETESGETTNVCFDLAVIRGKETSGDDQVALRTYSSECSGGDVSSQVIVIGRDVWASQFGDQWAVGRISPEMVEELTAEEDEYDELIAAASDIRPGAATGSYEFTAPASAFSQTEDLGDLDVDVDFELGLDERDYLRSLLATIDAEGVNAVIEEDFEVGGVAPLKPPPAGDVVGPVRQVDSEADLESLLEPTFSAGFE